MSSWKQHISNHKGIYLAAGGLTLAAFAAAYYFRKGRSGGAGIQELNYFPKEYENEAGISKSLSRALGTAFKGAIDYDLKIWLQPNENRFKGLVDISFSLDPEYKGDVYLSIQGLSVYQIKINDKKVEAEHLEQMLETQKGYIVLHNHAIENEIFKLTVKYSGEFGSTYGLIKYQDPRSENGDSYVFTSTNILGASSIYPVFESPEVRTMFRLAVATPKGWTALSNEKSDDPTELGNEFGKLIYEADPAKEDFHLFKFRQTKAIPFNSLNIASGKFTEFKTKTSVLGRKVIVYGLESEAGKLSMISEHIGKIVKSTVGKMEKLTGVKYPFSKCDFLILPDMLIFPAIFAINPIKLNKEYPGLSTLYLRDYHNFTAEFVFEAVTTIIRHWFGIIISPRWWSHLWLTEAFSRYLAFKLMKEEPGDFGLSKDEVYNLHFWLKSQAIYHESQNDVTMTNQSLIQDDIVNSFDALFLAQNKAEKVGLFKLEELFAFYSENVLTEVIQGLVKNLSWKAINYEDFKQCFIEQTQNDSEHLNHLEGCFVYQYLDEVKFSRTSENTLTVQRSTKENSSVVKHHLIEINFLGKDGSLIKKETAKLGNKPISFVFDSEVHTFVSVMQLNGIFYEIYEKDEISRLFEILKNNKQTSAEFRFKVGRILLANTLKRSSVSLQESFNYLKLLLDSCLVDEQRWFLRSFSVITKHIDKTKETTAPLHEFCSYLVGLARHNYELIPYLGFFGCFDHTCKEEVCYFVEDYNSVTKYNPEISLLNYDLLKSSILMIIFLRGDIQKATLFAKLVGTRDPAVGAILERITEEHIEDMATEHLKITREMKDMFLKKPTYDNALEYYFKSLLIRTDKTEEMQKMKEFFTEVRDNPDDHYVGGTKTFIYYNISKMLSAASRDEAKNEEEEMDLSPGVDAMVARRFKHHFKLA